MTAPRGTERSVRFYGADGSYRTPWDDQILAIDIETPNVQQFHRAFVRAEQGSVYLVGRATRRSALWPRVDILIDGRVAFTGYAPASDSSKPIA